MRAAARLGPVRHNDWRFFLIGPVVGPTRHGGRVPATQGFAVAGRSPVHARGLLSSQWLRGSPPRRDAWATLRLARIRLWPLRCHVRGPSKIGICRRAAALPRRILPRGHLARGKGAPGDPRERRPASPGKPVAGGRRPASPGKHVAGGTRAGRLGRRCRATCLEVCHKEGPTSMGAGRGQGGMGAVHLLRHCASSPLASRP